jgi:hypothetical protein
MYSRKQILGPPRSITRDIVGGGHFSNPNSRRTSQRFHYDDRIPAHCPGLFTEHLIVFQGRCDVGTGKDVLIPSVYSSIKPLRGQIAGKIVSVDVILAFFFQGVCR